MQFVKEEISRTTFSVSLLYRTNNGSNHRRCVTPDDDIADLPQEVQDKISAHWTALGSSAAWEAVVRPPADPVTPSEVKAEALRRILLAMEIAGYEDRGDIAMAFIIADKAGDTAKKTALSALYQHLKDIRSAGIALAQQDPIPLDYRLDVNWP